MTSLNSESFDILAKSILTLFRKNDSDYDCDYVNLTSNGTVASSDIQCSTIEKVVGDVDKFHDWLRPRLMFFFQSFYSLLQTGQKRANKRSHYVYSNLILEKVCKRKTFRKKMANEFLLDLLAMTDSETKTFYEGLDTEVKRRIAFLNCIKNYVYRLFLINVFCL